MQTPTQVIHGRLPPASTTGYPREDILKLVKIVDSYHDFKIADRLKAGMSGPPNPEIAKKAAALEVEGSRNSPPSTSAGAEYQTILGNYFNKIFPSINESTFFKSSGVTKSAPEASGRLFFEMECGPVLQATPSLGCVPTKTTCSTFNPALINDSEAIVLELDANFNDNDEDQNKRMGLSLLEWFFPEKTGGVGFSFDAQAAIVKDFMQPLNDKSKKFYTSQVVTPQNVLDSSTIGYYELKDKKNKYALFTDQSAGRTVYTPASNQEYSNLFTESFGSFQIVNRSYGSDKGTYNQDFDWVFQPKAGPAIPFNMEGGYRNTGPSVTFLSGLIYCWLRKEADKTGSFNLNQCLEAREQTQPNDRQVSPVSVVKGLIAAGAPNTIIPRLLFDIKRLGDHEQANGVYYYNNTAGSEYSTIFVTGDILSALYSRLLGNPTIYIRAAGGSKEDDDDGASANSPYIMCYRGTKLVTDPLVLAKISLSNTLTQLNYYLFTITNFIGLAASSDFEELLGNMEHFQDANPFSGENSDLKNLLLQAKIKNSYDFLSALYLNKDVNTKTDLLSVKKYLIKALAPKIPGLNDGNFTSEGLNIGTVDGLSVEQLEALNVILGKGAKYLEPKMNILSTYLQHFNKIKFVTEEGAGAIFSFHNTLFFSESKVTDTLDTINYKKEDIDNIVAAIAAIARGMRSNQEILAKERLQNRCFEFFNGFFNTDVFEKNSVILLLQDIVNKINQDNILPTMIGLFTMLKDPSDAALNAAVKVASDAAKERDMKIAEARNATAAAQAAARAAAASATDGADASAEAAAGLLKAKVKGKLAKKASRKARAAAAAKKAIKPDFTNRKGLKAQVVAKQAELKGKKLVAKPRPRARHGGATGKNPMQYLMAELFQDIYDLIEKAVAEVPNTLKLIPGNYIKQTQVYPHPYPYEMRLSYTPQMRTGTTLGQTAVGQTVVAQTAGGRKTRRRRRSGRQTRKVGGQYIKYKYGIGSSYDSKDQAKLVDGFFLNLIEKLKYFSDKNPAALRNSIRDEWYNFNAFLDAKGTPDLAEPTNPEDFTYDVRMLKAYIEFTDNIDAYLAPQFDKKNPLGDLSLALTKEGVTMYLDPQETLRIGTNNILAYSELIAKNTSEKAEYGADAKYLANEILCDYNISILQKHIEETQLLIGLVGETLPASLQYELPPLNTYEDETAPAGQGQGQGKKGGRR